MNYIDTETYNEVPLKHGTYKYTSTCECMIVTYAFEDGPVQLWDRTLDDTWPGELRERLDDPSELWTAHNSMFDRNVLRHALGVDVPVRRWRDTMVRAMTHGLPGGLDILCQILNVPLDQAKSKEGKRLIHMFCKPRNGERVTWEDRPEQWATFREYAMLDISAMRAIAKRLPSWNYSGEELELWFLDQKINDRGIQVDVDFATAAIRAVNNEQARLRQQTMATTGGALESTSKRDKMLAYVLAAYGIDLPDMQKATLERRVDDPDLPRELRELIAIRLQASASSTSKYKALLEAVSTDGRMRGTLQFSGAQRTRRWAGRKFQPQNLPRPQNSQADINFGIEAILAGCEHIVLDDVMRAASDAIRGCIIAPKGKKLVVADLANIEGRDAAWLAGEEWKLDAFRAYDNGTGPDLYRLAYAKSFNVSVDSVVKSQRQIGKVEELMLQYEGGVGAFITGADTYGIDLDQMAGAVMDALPQDVIDEARNMWEWCVKDKRNTFGLSQFTFMACDGIKRTWRRSHPGISSYWPELKEAFTIATNNPGENVQARRVTFRRDGAWLRVKLPSGRYLCYPAPRVHDDGRISYMGMNQYTKRWSRIYTYGGKLFENMCQAVAGDVLKDSMHEMEERGYQIVLTVHDEAVTEAPDSPEWNVDGLSSILATPRHWTGDMPLAAAGFETYRYRKDD